MLSWVFQHDYLDTCCFECLICMCFIVLYFAPVSAQLSMFHMERRSRNTLIIIIIITFHVATVRSGCLVQWV